MLITVIPFTGFYETIHNERVFDYDYEAELLREYTNNNDFIEEFLSEVHMRADFVKAREAYARDYCKEFQSETGIAIDFESLTSPREYNFATDKIYAHIELSELQRHYNEVDKAKLAQAFKERFTSRSGFHSFYDNQPPSKPLVEWDHNELETLLLAWIADNGYSHHTISCESGAWLEYDSYLNALYDCVMDDDYPGFLERIRRERDKRLPMRGTVAVMPVSKQA